MFLHFDNMWLRIISRIVLVPVIAGVSYEFIRFAGNSENKFVSMLCKPGMLLQMLTTREPDYKMIEVAIASVEEVFDWREYQRRCIAAVKSRAKLKETRSLFHIFYDIWIVFVHFPVSVPDHFLYN